MCIMCEGGQGVGGQEVEGVGVRKWCRGQEVGVGRQEVEVGGQEVGSKSGLYTS